MAAGCLPYADVFFLGMYGSIPAPQGRMPLTHERFCMVLQAAGKLSRKQELAISVLLTCPTLLAAAQQCGVAEVTLHRWLKEAGFQAAYREARRTVVQFAIVQVQRATAEAVETLRAVMHDSESPASARVSAAKTILDTAIKAIELEDLEARIVALETEKGMTR